MTCVWPRNWLTASSFCIEARALFVGTVQEMVHCQDETVQQFLRLDELVVPGRDDGYAIYT